MATIEQLRTGLIENIKSIKNKDILVDLSNYVDFRKQPAEILNEYQIKMLEMGMDDIKNGRVVTHEDVMKKAEKWLNSK